MFRVRIGGFLIQFLSFLWCHTRVCPSTSMPMWAQEHTSMVEYAHLISDPSVVRGEKPGYFLFSCILCCFLFYRKMHYNTKRGLAIACRLSVRLSLCDVDGL